MDSQSSLHPGSSGYVTKDPIRTTPARTAPPAGRALPVLIAEDDLVSARVLEVTLKKWGHSVITVTDGQEAWNVLSKDDAPPLALIDWVMPGLEGPEVCRRVKALRRPVPTHVILLTAKGETADVVAGLESGADDYMTKPFDRMELRSRLRVGQRLIQLQSDMLDRVRDLEHALGQVKELKGLLPMCAYCKKVRDDRDYWQQVETYVSTHSSARFSHGICPTCWHEQVEPDLLGNCCQGHDAATEAGQ